MRKKTTIFSRIFTSTTPSQTRPMDAASASSLVDGGGALNMRKLQQELVSAFVVSFPYTHPPLRPRPMSHIFASVSTLLVI